MQFTEMRSVPENKAREMKIKKKFNLAIKMKPDDECCEGV